MSSKAPRLPEGVLVADAGATKVDRAFASSNGSRILRTKGINPFFHDADDIASILKEEGWGSEGVPIERVHFYGAGCSSETRIERVREGLKRIWPNAVVEVEHDLLGAARASAGDEPALVGILGTGSNACSYDGVRILEQSGGLGFILGDEGSGAHLGKLLLRDHLDGYLSEDVERAFSENFPQKREDHIEAIHRGMDPSRYLSGFAPFIKEHLEDEAVRRMAREAFQEYVERHLLSFEGAKGSTLHTIGGIGEHFRGLLGEVLKEKRIAQGRSVVEPIRGLVAYHGEG